MSVDLEHQRAQLLALQGRLRAAAASVEHELGLDDESGELPSWGADELADHASVTYDREVDDTLEENAEEIPHERLEAVPYATLCIRDKRRLERG